MQKHTLNKVKLILINTAVLVILLLICLIVLFFYSKSQINSFFEIEDEVHQMHIQKDSLAMFTHVPNIKIYENWGTEQQKLTNKTRTNNLGFREDHDIIDKKNNEFRILITGDSHTDGSVKNNEDTFINVLEQQLNTKQKNTYFNCINGGTAYYTFRNYYGFIQKYLCLKPDVFIINVFTGNDFRESILFEDNRTSIESVYKYTYNKTIRKFFSKKKKENLHNQGVEQTLYYDYFNKDIETSLSLSKFYLKKIKTLCKNNNIKLVVTLLPSKLETDKTYKNEIKSLFKLSEKAINTNFKLTNNLEVWLVKNKIKTYNLTNLLKQAKQSVFWDHDFHINNNAHKLIGNYLNEQLELN